MQTVIRIAPGFGAIHLEDISTPACFEIERRLIEALPQPVMHDDVHGTAVVTFAAAIAACRHVDMRLDEAVVGQIGLGAAGFGIASLIHDAGVRRVVAADPNPAAQQQAREHGIEIADLETVMREADVVVATSGRPGLITPDLVRPGQVVLALTNPEPEITPDAALAAGAAFAADGTSVNNVLGYPGIFHGALLAGASSDQPRDEARRRLGPGRPHRRVRARARRPGPRGARRGRPGRSHRRHRERRGEPGQGDRAVAGAGVPAGSGERRHRRRVVGRGARSGREIGDVYDLMPV